MSKLLSKYDNVIFKPDEPKNTVKHGSLELHLEAGAFAPIHEDIVNNVKVWNPATHAITSGTIISPPRKINKPLRDFNERGFAVPYSVWAPYEVDMIMKEGDKCHFHYNTINDNCKIEFEGETYYYNSWTLFYVLERDGKIICMDNNILVEPIEESWQDIQTPSGIFLKPHPQKKYLQGIVRHFGNPLIPERDKWKDVLYDGLKVVFSVDSDWEYTIQDKTYYLMTYSDIVGLIEDNIVAEGIGFATSSFNSITGTVSKGQITQAPYELSGDERTDKTWVNFTNPQETKMFIHNIDLDNVCGEFLSPAPQFLSDKIKQQKNRKPLDIGE